jgi:hypothetical protein
MQSLVTCSYHPNASGRLRIYERFQEDLMISLRRGNEVREMLGSRKRKTTPSLSVNPCRNPQYENTSSL